ncbi:hypothetical protein EK904_011853 [Melospiza melodia maxima]|nr:hypothetical protein EK904_011853 [Melospiza melodia maxima]
MNRKNTPQASREPLRAISRDPGEQEREQRYSGPRPYAKRTGMRLGAGPRAALRIRRGCGTATGPRSREPGGARLPVLASPDMARGQQKIQSQQKNAKKQAEQKKKQGHDQKAAAKAALIYTCTVCRTQMPDPKTFKQHFESKHPKTPLPPELADVQA